MNILLVTPQFPYPPRFGFATRVYQLSKQLAKRHEVTLLSYARPDEREAAIEFAQQLPVHVVQRERMSLAAKRTAQAISMASSRPFASRSVYSPRMQQAINELCATQGFDIVQLEGSELCTFTFPGKVKIVLDEHNIEYVVFQRMREGERSIPRRVFNWVEQARFGTFERQSWSRVHGCVVTSHREVPIVRAHAPNTPVAVVHNGVDLRDFQPSGVIEPGGVVFNGMLTYRPNLDAAYYLVEEIWPLILRSCPDLRLTIVGRGEARDLRRLRRTGVEVSGEVSDVRPYLDRATVVVVPVRMGGGTRLKVLEGLALGKAMVSTPLGCEGVDVRDREHLLIADDAKTFASRVVELIEHPEIGRALGRNARQLMAQEYSWELAGKRLAALHERVIGMGDPLTPDAVELMDQRGFASLGSAG